MIKTADLKKYSDMLKTAAVAMKSLKAEYDQIEEKYEKLAKAMDVAFALFNNGSLPAEDLEDYIKEASTKDLEELELIKQASGYNANVEETFKVGTISVDDDKDYDLISYLLNS